MVSDIRISRWRKQFFQFLSENKSFAVEAGRKYLSVHPDDNEVIREFSVLLFESGLISESKLWLEKLIQMEALDERLKLIWVELLLQTGDYREARAESKTLIGAVDSEAGLGKLANLYTLMGEHELARKAYLVLSKRYPEAFNYQAGLGTVAQHQGDISASEAHFLNALKMSPGYPLVYFLLARLKRVTTEDNHINDLSHYRKHHNPTSLEYQQLCFSLAKELEDLGSYRESFKALKDGADSVKKNLNYTSQSDVETLSGFKRLNELPSLDPNPLIKDKKGIFILGMPRTGSTLIERILSSHSSTETYGETQALRAAICDSLEMTSIGRKSISERVERGTLVDYQAIRDRYYSGLVADGGGQVFIEKLPHNIFYLGVILRSFPDAKIVYTDRGAMDSCYSNYKQLFVPKACPYSYDLEWTADFYMSVNNWVDYWDQLYPGRIYRVSYDKLVMDPNAEILALLNFTDLEYEEACTSPEKNLLASTTASSVQVRSPINKGSLQQWKKFETELAPLREYLLGKGLDECKL